MFSQNKFDRNRDNPAAKPQECAHRDTDATIGRSIATMAGKDLRRVLWSSIIGSTIEWYDFLIYAAATSFVFDRLFFASQASNIATIAAFGVYAVGFLSRPLGAIVFGHFGDRVGRKPMLVATIMIMGLGTVLIGMLPTYDQAGIAAPILLVGLRFLQGLGIGGEWAGSVLMVVENTSPKYRGLLGSLVQLGNPLGHIFAISIFSTLSRLPDADFLAWGWRIPFLASVTLFAVGIFVRNSINETPAFRRLVSESAIVGIPIVEVLRHHRRAFLVAAGLKLADITYATIGGVFAISYMTKQLRLSPQVPFTAILVANLLALFTIPLFGWLADKVGRKPLFYAACLFCLVFAFPFFQLLQTKDSLMAILAISAAINFGQMIMFGIGAPWYAELFDPKVRYTGVSFGFQIGAAIGGGLTPVIASGAIIWTGGATWPISLYLITCSLLTMIAVRFAPETARSPIR
jgi:MFS transporter, MHS family, shikimate and dehydroshikimate transport protein